MTLPKKAVIIMSPTDDDYDDRQPPPQENDPPQHPRPGGPLGAPAPPAHSVAGSMVQGRSGAGGPLEPPPSTSALGVPPSNWEGRHIVVPEGGYDDSASIHDSVLTGAYFSTLMLSMINMMLAIMRTKMMHRTLQYRQPHPDCPPGTRRPINIEIKTQPKKAQ